MLIRQSVETDFETILAIVNDASRAYRGVIPQDRWHDPYMRRDQLQDEMASGVIFWVAEEAGTVLGVMGIQDKGDVTLVRHAYVATTTQRGGIGTALLHHIQNLSTKPILIGTWADAVWAIAFYERNGFALIPERHKDDLLQKYWSIPPRQIETSVVLADPRWIASQSVTAASHSGAHRAERLE
jgi:N-acetylglutamate synthase-like GNAT family acetyltransferase